MCQEDLFIHLFCMIDDQLKDMHPARLRARGPSPTLSDSEVIAIECGGELIGIDTDAGIFSFCRQHMDHLFPLLRRIDRTTFVRQGANLWQLKKQVQEHLAAGYLRGRGVPLMQLDSFPLPIGRFARAPSCKRLAGVAGFGFDHTIGAVFYGLRVHLRCACGLTLALDLAAAGVNDRDMAAEMIPPSSGPTVADRNYWSPILQEELLAEGKEMLAPFIKKSRDPRPKLTALLSKLRQPIEPLIGQLAVRLNAKRTWAKDLWHLCSRMIRKVLAHTAAVVLNASLGNPPSRLELLIE